MASNYAKISINDLQADITNPEDIPFSITSEFEDVENFQQKKGSDSFSIELPASLINSKAANTFFNPSIQDMTNDQNFRKAGSCVIEFSSMELLVGKAFLRKAKHGLLPLSYTFDVVGDNKDWGVSLKETTLFDLLDHLNFTFTKQRIIDSWVFDGRDENLP